MSSGAISMGGGRITRHTTVSPGWSRVETLVTGFPLRSTRPSLMARCTFERVALAVFSVR